MSIDVINDFRLGVSDGRIFELCFNDVRKQADKADRYQWYLILSDKRYTLRFESMIDSVRHFSIPYTNMTVMLDVQNMKITTNTGSNYTLTKA